MKKLLFLCIVLPCVVFSQTIAPKSFILSQTAGFKFTPHKDEADIILKYGDTIKLVSLYKLNLWRAEYKGKKGFINEVYLNISSEYADFKNKFIPEITPDQEAKTRKASLIKKYGVTYGTLISSGKIRIGMTKQMAIDSWGEADKINKTVGKWGVHEQWVYEGNGYLYFENGKLTSWQD